MTQIEAADGSDLMPNPPPDITKLYQSLKSLLDSAPRLDQNALELASPLNLVAFVAHAVLTAHQFRLKNNHWSHQDTAPELATDWEALKDSKRSIHGNYVHPRSSLGFEFSFGKLGNRISISGITVESDKVFTHDLSISGYFDEAQFPVEIPRNANDYGSVGFRSTSHLLDFMSFFINDVLHHLLPDLVPKTSPQTSSPPPPASTADSSRPDHSSLHPSPMQGNSQGFPHTSPFSIGRSDLDPIGTSNLRIPSMYNQPSGGINPSNPPDGMLVGPNHPIFDPLRSTTPALGPFGGDGFLPGGAVPSRARFDPVGPGPGFLPPGRGARFGMDPMGGLGQGLPMGSAFPSGGSMGGQGRDFPGYDDMFS